MEVTMERNQNKPCSLFWCKNVYWNKL